jgi:hypothetical protein
VIDTYQLEKVVSSRGARGKHHLQPGEVSHRQSTARA